MLGGSNKLRLAVEIVATVALAIIVARLLWSIAAPSSAIDVSLPTSGGTANPTLQVQLTPADRSVLVKSNPFVRDATVEQAADERLGEGPDAPETELNLRLTGIRALSGGRDAGSVWIIKPDGQEVTVGVGDTIISGVTLEQIYNDSVTIRSRGRLESLSRRDEETSFSSVRIDDRRQSDRVSNTPVSSAPINALDLYNEISFGRIAGDRGVRGYRLSPKGSGAVFAQSGLVDGDILLSLNGQPVSKFGNNDFVEFFAGQSRVTALVEREGVEVAVQLNLTEDT